MSIVIVGGNERMERQYKDICEKCNCKAKVFCKMTGTFQKKIGNPDVLILLTNTVSHKMVQSALCEVKQSDTKICRLHSSSASCLKNLLTELRREKNMCLAEA